MAEPAVGRWRDAARLAAGTLTAVPVPPPATLDPPVPGTAMLLAPLAGLLPGAVGALAAWLALQPLGLGPTVAAVIAVAAGALVTRGLHLDGLADTADGLAASYDRQRALEVMRRGDVGPAGATALVLVLLLQVSALSVAIAARGPVVVLVLATAARVAVPVCCLRGVPAARPGGMGAQVAGSVPGLGLAAAAVGTGAFGALVLALAGQPWWRAPLAVLLTAGVAGWLVRRAGRRLGGITGDVIGAAVELAAAAAALTLAVHP